MRLYYQESMWRALFIAHTGAANVCGHYAVDKGDRNCGNRRYDACCHVSPPYVSVPLTDDAHCAAWTACDVNAQPSMSPVRGARQSWMMYW